MEPVDPKLIASYYAVAADLQAHAQSMLRTAELLAQTADKMSEANMLKKQPTPDSATCSETEGHNG